jgi:hypothetical protein
MLVTRLRRLVVAVRPATDAAAVAGAGSQGDGADHGATVSAATGAPPRLAFTPSVMVATDAGAGSRQAWGRGSRPNAGPARPHGHTLAGAPPAAHPAADSMTPRRV